MELLIKKIYSNIYNETNIFNSSKFNKNIPLRKNCNNINGFNKVILSLTEEKNSIQEKINLYTMMTQSLPKASYDIFLLKNYNNLIKINELNRKNGLIFKANVKDAFGGVWSSL